MISCLTIFVLRYNLIMMEHPLFDRAILLLLGCSQRRYNVRGGSGSCFTTLFHNAKPKNNANSFAIVMAARNQIGKTIMYDSSYVLSCPGGGAHLERRVCMDVVVRALAEPLSYICRCSFMKICKPRLFCTQ